MKKILGINLFLALLLASSLVQANEDDLMPIEREEPTVLLLQCKYGPELIENRLSGVNYELVDKDRWNVSQRESFYYVPFGVNWEDVEQACYAYSAYIEIATYTRTEPYVAKKECRQGIFGKGPKYLRDSWGGYFEGNYTNTFIEQTNTCNIRATYKFVSNEARRIPQSKKYNCDLAKKHFYNQIIDPEYGKDGWLLEWQKRQCKEITKEEFETKVGISVRELKDVLAKDVI